LKRCSTTESDPSRTNQRYPIFLESRQPPTIVTDQTPTVVTDHAATIVADQSKRRGLKTTDNWTLFASQDTNTTIPQQRIRTKPNATSQRHRCLSRYNGTRLPDHCI
jgi:hypothetical protein